MTDLTMSAASSVALPTKAAPPSVNAPGSSNQGGFCQVMNDKQFKPKIKAPADEEKWQDDAATGKELPDKDKSTDPALAWLLGGPAIVLPAPTPVPTPLVTAIASPPVTPEAVPDGAPAVLTATVAPEVKPLPVEPQGICDVDVVKPKMLTQPEVAPAAPPDASPQPIKLPPLQLRIPEIATSAAPATSAAVLPALFALSMTADRSDRDDNKISTLASVATPLSQPTTALSVAPMADTQRQMLDMGRQDWPQKMIDHIEALRDNANANDASIRLKPEALGRVDIALRTHTDGAISVRFTAEQPSTRTMLVDATPQLSAAAEARGIRLSGTSVDLSGQGDQRSQSQTDRARPTTNRLADVRADDKQAADDGRIA
ncbi:MAG: flagellar hook-length control protein FliK [Sphingomonas sp.]|uniref:flagellar hook-length control protein FliK n=1 Tax=Sphingomonas sp. TaxID=28214 RepID=UPI001ACA103E|nr:flagellar hook-length control protein FliK [Sphingomonas sp.]MBN8816417.1 flagellar hook-length control protein FliK [Sphingomonas sp.]